MVKEKKTIKVNDREKRVIRLVTLLNDKELFGLECFVAGMGVREKTEEKADWQRVAQGAEYNRDGIDAKQVQAVE